MEYSDTEKQMLREVLPGIAVQLRGALANIHGALGRLAPEQLRDRDNRTDHSAAILCQSYYQILRVVNNLSDAPMLAEDKPFDTENVELVELAGRPEPPGAGPGGVAGPESVLHLPGPGPRHRRQPGAFRAAVLEPGVQRHEVHAFRRHHRGVPADGAGLRAAVREGQRPRHSGRTKLERLFDRWQHSSMDPARSTGLGLGLPLCRRIAQGHGGSLMVSSRQGGGHRGDGAPAGSPQRRDPDAPAALPLCRRLQPGAGGAGRRPAGPGVHPELY